MMMKGSTEIKNKLIIALKALFGFPFYIYKINHKLNSIIELLSKPIPTPPGNHKIQDMILNEFRFFKQLNDINNLSEKCNIDLSSTIDTNFIDQPRFVDLVYEVEKNNKHEIFNKIMNFKDTSPSKRERGGPCDTVGLYTGNYQRMLKRYFFAGKIFSENKRVMDSCSGAGWGAYILSHYAKEVVAYDRGSEVVEMCDEYWSRDNINWISSDALNFELLKGERFDVVTAMETIEHFTKEDGQKYIENKQRFLDKGGIFIGTSSFPDTREQAEKSPVLLNFEDHLYLWTKKEMIDELSKYFSKVRFIGNWIFIAQK